MSVNLKPEYQYYLDNKSEFLKKYEGKFIVIKNKEVIGVYSNVHEAVEHTAKTVTLGTFLVQHVSPDEDQVRFHSRVG